MGGEEVGAMAAAAAAAAEEEEEVGVVVAEEALRRRSCRQVRKLRCLSIKSFRLVCTEVKHVITLTKLLFFATSLPSQKEKHTRIPTH